MMGWCSQSTNEHILQMPTCILHLLDEDISTAEKRRLGVKTVFTDGKPPAQVILSSIAGYAVHPSAIICQHGSALLQQAAYDRNPPHSISRVLGHSTFAVHNDSMASKLISCPLQLPRHPPLRRSLYKITNLAESIGLKITTKRHLLTLSCTNSTEHYQPWLRIQVPSRIRERW